MEKHDSKRGYLVAAAVLFGIALFVLFYRVNGGLLRMEQNLAEDIEDLNSRDLEPLATDELHPPPPPPEYSSSSSGINDEPIFDVVEEEPVFSGGEKAMTDFIRSHVKYPEISIQMGDQGKVYVRFVVEKDGRVTNVSIARDVTPQLDKEAMRVILMMPNWKPGLQRGVPVRTNVVVPIVFKLG